EFAGVERAALRRRDQWMGGKRGGDRHGNEQQLKGHAYPDAPDHSFPHFSSQTPAVAPPTRPRRLAARRRSTALIVMTRSEQRWCGPLPEGRGASARRPDRPGRQALVD